MRHSVILMLVALALVTLAACSAAEGGEAAPTTAPEVTSTTAPLATSTTAPLAAVPTEYADFRQQDTACGSSTPDPVVPMQFTAPEDMDVAGPVTVTLVTSCGPIVVELDPAAAPETVNSFVFLATQGYFDGSASHRIIPGFMMQAGDQTATGLGGPGYVIPDELPSSGAAYQRGTIAMANAGSGTGGSQFFILFDAADWLPPDYAVFGTVVDGFGTLDAIETIELGFNPFGGDRSPSVPLASLYIESVSIER